MKNYLPENNYDTPEDTRRCWMDKIFLNSRWGFFLRFLKIVFSSSNLAVKGLYTTEEWSKHSFKIFRLIEACGGRFHLRGLDNLNRSPDPLVIVSNHMSTLETVVLPGIIAPRRNITFVVKESLVNMPVFGHVMRSRKPIVVGRTNPREDLVKVLTEGERILNSGQSLVIFPQSTRYLDFNPEKFNSLGVKLAKRAGVKILPLAIKTDYWANGKRFKEFGPIDRSKPIYMTFGEPMEIKGNGKEEHQKTIDFISSQFELWQ